jgi:hypothetical protein
MFCVSNLRPQNRQAEWLACQFYSSYIAGDALWKTLDFGRKSAKLGAWCQHRFEMQTGRTGFGFFCFNNRTRRRISRVGHLATL